MTITEYRARCKALGVKPLSASQCSPLITQHGGAHIDEATDYELANDWQDMVLNVIAWGCLIVFLLIAGGLALGFASVKFGWTF